MGKQLTRSHSKSPRCHGPERAWCRGGPRFLCHPHRGQLGIREHTHALRLLACALPCPTPQVLSVFPIPHSVSNLGEPAVPDTGRVSEAASPEGHTDLQTHLCGHKA